MRINLPAATLVAASLVPFAAAQSVTSIPAMTVPAFSTVDMDAAGAGPGPVTAAAVAAAGVPGPAAISAITFTANGGPAGVYNTNPQGLAIALGPGGTGMELIAPPSGAFSAADLQIDLLIPSTEFGLNIGDWVSTATLNFYNAGALIASTTTAAFSTGTGNQFFQVSGGTFDRVDVIAGGNWVITELVIEGSAANFAQALPYGSGCGGVADFATVYENFATGTFDLGGTPGAETVVTGIFSGNGYVVLPGASTWFTPVAPDLGLADDAVSGSLSLGFAAPLPDGSVFTDVYVSSNGFVWLGTTGNNELSPSTALMSAGGPRMMMYWDDLRPASGGGTGTIHFDVDPVGGVAYVTFLGIEQFANPAALIDMQLAIFAAGNWELRYGAETVSVAGTGPSYIGFTPGNGALVPPSADFSTLPIVTAPDLFVPNMSLASDRPIEGTTMNVTISDIPPGTVLGTIVLSGTQFNPGIQPVPGLGDCLQYAGLSEVFTFLPTGSSFVQPFPVPAAGFTGLSVYAQAITLSPGLNPLGVASSNGINWIVDVN